jgi:hypothetical protein
MSAEIIYLPTPKHLTIEQEQHWEEQLEIADRMRQNALRMLGRLGIERGLAE